MRRLLTLDNPGDEKLLRRPAKRVNNVQSTEVILGIQDMKRIAHEWEAQTGKRCEGLAATQIGWNARVLILRATDEMRPVKPEGGMMFHPLTETELRESRDFFEKQKTYKDFQRNRAGVYDPWVVMVNPQVLQVEGFQETVEGCLSVPGSLYKVVRPTLVAFKYRRPNNTVSGVHLARGDNAMKFCHENEHLLGKLLPDVALEAYVGETTSEPL